MTFPLMPFIAPQAGATSFSGAGTFTVPLGVTSLSFTIRGAGGGYGGTGTANYFGSSPQTAFGGGGGTGATTVGTISVSAGDTIVVTTGAIGAVGSSGTISSTSTFFNAPDGSPGGTTTITRNGTSVATAVGGSGGGGGYVDITSGGTNRIVRQGPGGAGGNSGTGGTVTAGANGITSNTVSGPAATSTITW